MRSLLGHKSRCFDCRFDACGERLISSSEDGTSKIFHLDSVAKKPLSIVHNTKSEVIGPCLLIHSFSYALAHAFKYLPIYLLTYLLS